jgi:hypothetical protein
LWDHIERVDSNENRLLSFLMRSVCHRSNSNLTSCGLGEDPTQDITYNLGIDVSNELLSLMRAVCESSYTQTKASPSFDVSKDDVNWISFLRSSQFDYLISLQSTVDYCHEEIRYVNTLTRNDEIAHDLRFLIEIADNANRLDGGNSDAGSTDYDDDDFDLLRDTKRLAHNLTRLRTLARYDKSKNVGFAILALMRKFLVNFTKYERDRVRKILTFTASESQLVFRAIDVLTPSELVERTTLLQSHRHIRTSSNNSHL